MIHHSKNCHILYYSTSHLLFKTKDCIYLLYLKQKTSRKFEKVRLLRQSPYDATQQVYFLLKRGTKASIICYIARIHNMDSESCDFRNEELLWCRMCTPGKSVSREYQRKLKVVIFNCLSWLFTSCTKERWSFGSCTNVVLLKSNVTYKPNQVPHINGKHIYRCQASQVYSRFYPS